MGMKRPTFSLRDLLWLFLVAALMLGWWIDQAKSHTAMDQLQMRVVSASRIAGHFAATLKLEGYKFDWKQDEVTVDGSGSHLYLGMLEDTSLIQKFSAVTSTP